MQILILTERGSEIYKALRAVPDWLSTQQIADMTGKNQLSPHDRKLLKDMVKDGYIEEKLGDPLGVGKRPFLYRAI